MPGTGQANVSEMAHLMPGAPSYAAGWEQMVYVPSPAAGANWSYKIDGRYAEQLVSVRFVLVTSAVVANRFPVLYLQDTNGVNVLSVWAGGTVPASKTNGVNLSPEYTLQSNYGGVETFGPLPKLLVPGGYTWQSTVQNIDVGDTITGVVLKVQRFPSDTVTALITD